MKTEESTVELERYFNAGRAAGCPEDQLNNFLHAGIVLQPRQLAAAAAARLCDAPRGPTEIGYGGARGGGKSHWLLAQIGADDCQRMPELKCLLLRKVAKANIEHFDDLRRVLFGGLPHDFAAYRGILTFANGSRIIAGHFHAEKDIDAYLGLEYDVIGIEEATTLSWRKYEQIRTCCRSSKFIDGTRRWRPRIYSTTNPGGIGHAWYRSRFITPHRAEEEKETRFVPARVTDNPFANPDYKHVLESLRGWQRRAWFEGDWEITAGQFFTTFRRETHIIGSGPDGPTFDPKRAREWFAALDYGFTHYTVVLLGCKDADGNTFVVDEHAERLWVPERHAAAIKKMLERHGLNTWKLSRIVAGTDVFARQSDGLTVADQYRKHGIRLKPANMDRQNGWAEVLSRLGDPANGVAARLFIHKRCVRLCESLPGLQHDPNHPEDVLKVDMDENGLGGDDAADALRYLVATKPRVPWCMVV